MQSRALRNVILGFDIGGTNLKAGVLDASGQILRRETVPTPATLSQFRTAAAGLISRLAGDQKLSGAGFGCPGIVRPEDTLVDCLPGRMDYLEGSRLSDLVAPWLSPNAVVAADNDARAALAGELAFGAARGRRNALMLTLGSGVGGAIVSGGVLLRGHAGVAGHIGHLTTNPDGPICLCGNQGCLETYFSARAIEVEALAAIQRGCESSLRTKFGTNPLSVTCADVFECAAEGDRIATAILERALRYLGGAIAGLLHVLDSEVVILGGQIAQAGPVLFDTLRADVDRRTRRLLRRTIPIIPAEVGEHAGIVGAASLAFTG